MLENWTKFQFISAADEVTKNKDKIKVDLAHEKDINVRCAVTWALRARHRDRPNLGSLNRDRTGTSARKDPTSHPV